MTIIESSGASSPPPDAPRSEAAGRSEGLLKLPHHRAGPSWGTPRVGDRTWSRVVFIPHTMDQWSASWVGPLVLESPPLKAGCAPVRRAMRLRRRPEPTLGPLGSVDRLNWLVSTNRRRNSASHVLIVARL